MGKKLMSALLAGALALSMCGTALAAGNTGNTENDKATIEAKNDGVSVEFSQDPATPDLIDVIYKNDKLKDGDQFVVLMVKGDENADITQDSILYIDQVAAQGGQIQFKVYPSSIQNSIIAIYGIIPQADGSTIQKLVAAIVKGKFILGDIYEDTKINSRDLIRLAQHIAGSNPFPNYIPAADLNQDAKINMQDVVMLARVVAGLLVLD